MSREMKDSGIECIRMIPKDWEIRKYKYFAKSGMGNTILKEELTEDQIENSVPVYSATQDEKIFGYLKNPNLILNKNDFVIPARGNSIGWITLIKDEAATCTQTTIYSKISNIIPKFLYYCGSGLHEYWFEFDNTAIPQITVNQVQNNIVPVPSIVEQQKIANFLDKRVFEIDNVIEKTTQSIKEYKKYKQSIITETVTKGLNPNVEMKDSGIYWIGEIPNHWHVTKTKNITNKITDGAHVSPETDNGIYDFISTVNIKNDKIDFVDCLKTSVNSYNQLVKNGCKPLKGDVLISKDGTVGKTVIVDFDRDFVVASSLVIMRPINTINSFFLNYVLKSKFVQEQLNSFMKGSGLKRVSVGNNGNLIITVPPEVEQHEIAGFLDKKCLEIDSLISQKQKLLTDIELYKKSLIYECVTGKKEVN